MDSNDLERERGITILSKNTAVRYKVSHQQITSKHPAQVLRAGKSVAADHCLLESISGLHVHCHAGYPC